MRRIFGLLPVFVWSIGCSMVDYNSIQSIQETKMIVFLKTQHHVEYKKQIVYLNSHLEDPCDSLNRSLINMPTGGPGFNIVDKALLNCQVTRDKLYLPALNAMLQYKTSFKRIRRSAELDSPRTNKLTFKPTIEEFKPASTIANVFSGLGSIVGVPAFTQYFSKESSYNRVFDHEGMIHELVDRVNIHTEQFDAIVERNKEAGKSLGDILTELNENHKRVRALENIMPNLMDAVSKANDLIRLETKKFSDILAGIRKGVFQIDAFHRTNPSVEYMAPEDTKFIDLTANDTKIRYSFYFERANPHVFIYKIYTFKDWLNESNYLKYSGSEWIVFNSTNNCSAFIEAPASRWVNEACTLPNSSLDFNMPEFWKKITFPPSRHLIETKPQIITLEDSVIIQCYQHTLKVGGVERKCGKTPYKFSLNQSISIDGDANIIDVVFKEHTYESSQGTIMVGNQNADIWTSIYEKNLERLERIEAADKRIESLQRGSTIIALFEKDPVVVGGISVTAILSLTVMVSVIICVFRKTPIERLAESQMVMNLAKSNYNAPATNPAVLIHGLSTQTASTST